MFRKLISQFGFAVVALVAVLFSAYPVKAQTASHFYAGDVSLSCAYANGAQTVTLDDDANTGQVIEVLACPSAPTIGQKTYGFSWLPYDLQKSNIKAAINKMLATGCVGEKGCGSVRYYTMTANGTSNIVVDEPYEVYPSFTVTPTVGATYNQVVLHIQTNDVALQGHSIDWGDGSDPYLFDYAANDRYVPHDFDWKGGTFPITTTVALQDGSVQVISTIVVIPHP